MKMMKKIFTKEVIICMALFSIAGATFAQSDNFSMGTLQDKTTEATDTLKNIALAIFTVVGLIASGITGWKVFSGREEGYKHIISFVVTLVVMGIGIAMFT